ncbi:MAG: hypothetical protein ABI432_08995 [Flavobacteriales bacterium]
MARTITQIYDAIIAAKEAQLELLELVPNPDTSQLLLSDLTTSSRVSRWRLMVWVFAVAAWTHEKLWDQLKAEIEVLAAGSHIGTLRWYVEKAKVFQYGYFLENIGNVPGYSVIDIPSRIIARAAGKEAGGYVLLKVAKLSGTDLVGLGPTELLAFAEYIDEIKMAGTIVNIITDVGDMLKIPATVYYNPLMMAPDGSLILQPTVFPVEDAINAFLANIPFNGVLTLTALVDAMQAAQGVTNPVLGTVLAKYGLFSYQPIVVEYTANAGHYQIDPANLLATTLTYVPHVV